MIKEKRFTTESGKLLEKLIFQIMKEFQNLKVSSMRIPHPNLMERFKELKNRPRAHLSFAGQLLQCILKTATTFEKIGNPKKSPAKAENRK